MPTLTVREDIAFHYTDSGPVEQNEYSTLVFVHGFSFHTATFQKLFPVAGSYSLRVICLSRREYQGSSPYTDEELRVINHGTHEECAGFLKEQGHLIALFLDGIIRALSLPKAGGLTVIGWSLGNVFTLGLRACIGDLPMDIQERLRSYASSFIIWDPPAQALGFDFPRPQISEDVFLATFPKFVSTHYKHVDLDSKDPSKLDTTGDPLIKPTTETMTPEELSSMLDVNPSFKCDLPLLSPTFLLVISDQMAKALLDSQVHEDWGGIPVWYICGDRNVPGIQMSSWFLEDRLKSEDTVRINFKMIKDANHFLMWEEPDRCLATMKECMLA